MTPAVSEIRLAVPADAARIAAMSRDYIEAGLTWSWTPDRVLHSIRDRSSNVVVLDDPGTLDAAVALAGFGIMHYGDDIAHLALLAVRPEQRHQGLGTRLLSWLEQPARAAGILRIRLEARADNPDAIEFYARLGYRPNGRVSGYYQGMIDAVRLEKLLACAAFGNKL